MSKKFLFLTAAMLAVILLSGCTGGSVRGNTWPGLSATNDVAYLTDGPFVYAVNLKDGTELWRYPGQRSNKLLFYTTPYVTSDGLVIVGSSGSDASLLALKPNGNTTPTVAWSYAGVKYHWVATPLQIDDRLYAPNSDGNLYVASSYSGQVLRYHGTTGASLGGFTVADPVRGPFWIKFGADGSLYTTIRTSVSPNLTGLFRFDFSTGAPMFRCSFFPAPHRPAA
jgi:hypothetical protein